MIKKKLINKIFINNLNNEYKSIPFKERSNFVGAIKYFPATSKE
jgi:hypothetical protein